MHRGTRRTVVLVGAALVVAPLLASTPAGAVTPRAAAFSVVQQLQPSTEVPGALACAQPAFCLELAASDSGLGGSPTTTLVSDDAGRSWRRAAPIPASALPGGSATADSEGSTGSGVAGLTASCSGPGVCVAGGDGTLARTTNGATSWSVRRGLPQRWSLGGNVACLPDGACLAVGLYAGRLSTAWLGAQAARFSVERHATLAAGISPRAVACPSTNRCLLAVAGPHNTGELFVTTRLGAGVRWRMLTATRGHVFGSLSCPSVSVCEGLSTWDTGAEAGSVVLERSTDGGASWRGQTRVEGATLPTTVACTSITSCSTSVGPEPERQGVADVFTSGSPLPAPSVVATTYTTDGGRTWHREPVVDVAFGDTPSGFASCLGPGRCVADGAGSSGGNTVALEGVRWVPVPTDDTPTSIPSVTCTTASTCLRVDLLQGASGFTSRLEQSMDGGVTWSPLALPAGDDPIAIGGCQGPATCEVIAVRGVGLDLGQLGSYDYAGSSVVDLATSDAGATWTSSTVASGEIPLAASCSSALQCVVVDEIASDPELGELVATQDGATWTSTQIPGLEGFPSSVLAELVGAGTVPALSCGAGGDCLYISSSVFGDTFLRSTDGGATWIVANPPGPAGQFTPEGGSCTGGGSCAVVVNDSSGNLGARLYTSTDGGATWLGPFVVPSTLPGGTGSSATSLSCWSASGCLVTTETNAELSVDGGATWSAVSVPGASGNPLGLGPIEASDVSCASATTCVDVSSSLTFDFASSSISISASTELLALSP